MAHNNNDDDGWLWGLLPQDYLRKSNRCCLSCLGNIYCFPDGCRLDQYSQHGSKREESPHRAQQTVSKEEFEISSSLCDYSLLS